MNKFQLVSNYEPAGDQPQAINQLVDGLNRREKYQTLLGVTGSGKTFTISNIIQAVNKPTLIISHNKTLAAQLYSEFKAFFPDNAVEFFISYYDYYQPEAYVVRSDLYIEKDFSINEEIDRLRLKATTSLIEGRRDVIVVASVSCIYGIGAPQEYAYQNEEAIRIEFWDDDIEKLSIIDSATGHIIKEVDSSAVYPAKYFVSNRDQIQKAIHNIELELKDRLEYFRSQEKYLEAQRIEQRTRFDIEMMKEIGYCSGIENYSRHMDGRTPGSRPYNLLDYFPKDFLLVIDESHVTVPQIRGMYNGDRSRKETLVEYGFRLPSALDNRPMKFEEFESMLDQVIFVSATPADFELQKSGGVVVEQIIRPTGLLDPDIEVRPIKGQIDDLIGEIRERSLKKERVLVTTLTKKMSEDLADYLDKIGILVRYIHSDIDSLERVEILRDLRLGDFDGLVGVNLLREGLDLPEVSLVAIIDADKEGFLRSERSLMQTAGRTARNVNGKVIMYADKITESMDKVIKETARRRKLQEEYNIANGINPKTILKTLEEIMSTTIVADSKSKLEAKRGKKKHDQKKTSLSILTDPVQQRMNPDERKDLIGQLRKQMIEAAKDLEFERAAEIRDEIKRLD